MGDCYDPLETERMRWPSWAASRYQGQAFWTPATIGYIYGIYGERRWRDADGDLVYTWDGPHRELEVYDTRGEHIGVDDPMTGERIKPARIGRRIRV
jgi:hypothetical protein